MKLSDYIMQFIARQGVGHIFYLPGGGAMHLVDSLGKLENVEVSLCMNRRLPSPLNRMPCTPIILASDW